MTEPNLLNIVGFIKVNEAIPERVRYLIACIRSFIPIRGWGRFILKLDQPSEWLYHLVDRELQQGEFDYELTRTFKDDPWLPYGVVYSELLENNRTDFVLNFIEDHFLMSEPETLNLLLNRMAFIQCEVMKAAFWEVENKTVQGITDKTEDDAAYYYLNDEDAHDEAQQLWNRYYIGVNFITTLDFAKKFWDVHADFIDPNSMRPHYYEMVDYKDEYLHSVMVPKTEVMASIDDDHGVTDSCLLKRKDTKFNTVMDNLDPLITTKMIDPIGLFNINNYTIRTDTLGNHLHGSIVREFEQSFCKYVGAKYGCSMNSATSALTLVHHLFYDTRYVPSMIPPVVVNALLHAGCKVHFVDDTNWVGWSYQMKGTGNGRVIIDSAQRVDKDQYLLESHSDDDVMIFSHYPTKPVGGMDGAMIVSNNKDKIDYWRTMSLNGMNFRENNWERSWQHIGHKMYMNAAQAYVANENLKLLPDKKRKLEKVRTIYNEAFQLDHKSDHLYRIETAHRDQFIKDMQSENIVCGIHYHAAHLHFSAGNPLVMSGMITHDTDMSRTERLAQRTVSIPFHENLTEDQIYRVIAKVKKLRSND